MTESPFMKVKIENISLSNLGFIIFLKHTGEKNVLPICIGAAEAHSIAAAYNNHKFPRPLSHDLFKNVLGTLHCQVSKIHVTELVDGTFFARIFMHQDGIEIDVDSRPSDAIALALRFEAPIYVHQDVYRAAAVNINQTKSGEDLTVLAEEHSLDPVDRLKTQLDRAVQEEKYEVAAKIRDELERIQAGN
jgi:bifunctional DNase/RNase